MTEPLTAAALRLLAWQGPFDPCSTCAETRNRRCRTAAGEVTTPHKPRMDQARGFVARQPEVAELQHALDQSDALLSNADDALRRITAERDTLKTDLRNALAETAGLTEQNARITADLKLTNAENALLRKRVADIEAPEPEPTGTLFGACILTGGATGVVTKYGPGASIRQFLSGLTVPTIPNGSLIHVSAKPAATVTDAAIDTWLLALRGHIVTIRHEPDNDGMSDVQIAEWKALNNRLYDRNVALGRPCLVAPTFTGGLFASYGNDATRDKWMVGLKGDLLGIDFDGVHDNQTSKPADLVYRVGSKEITNADEIANVLRYIAKYATNGWQGFTVPEFGISRAKWDTDGAGRTKWLKDNAQRFIDAGAYAVHWYDFQDTKTLISDIVASPSPELDALRELVASNPTRSN